MPCAVWAQAAIEDSLPLTDDPSDPIGIDRDPTPSAADSSKPVKPAPASKARYGPEPPALNAQVGEVLTAPANVHEHAHRVAVELSHALARVQVELELESTSEKPAEVQYRLAVPSDAALFALEICNTVGCRNGLPQPAGQRLNAYDDAVQARAPTNARGLPAGDARLIKDARGTALLLRAAPVSRSHQLQVRVSYAAAGAEHAGQLRLALPARGMDPRIAPGSLTVQATGYTDVRLNELPISAGAPAPLDPVSAVELQASAASRGAHAELLRTPCGARSCLRAYATAPAEAESPAEIYLAIDASPSTEGEARSRFLTTVAALLSDAPAGSHVRALRFASQAVPLIAERKAARELTLSAFGPIAFEAELGSSTRFESAWQVIERSGFLDARGRKLVIVLGDGGITTGPARPFDAARRKGVEVAVINVSNRSTTSTLARGAQLTGGAVIDAGPEADIAARGGDAGRLEERLAAVFQPSRGFLQVSGARGPGLELRAGDSVVWEGAPGAAPAIKLGHRGLSASEAPHALAAAIAAHAQPAVSLVAVDRADLQARSERPDGQDAPPQRGGACDRRGPALRASGLSSDSAPVQLASERAICAIPVPKTRPKSEEDAPELGAGMPGSPLLGMLRQRIMPIARGCFRRDRAGRPDYQVRAVFVFELAEREVVAASVQGKIEDALRSCLLQAVDGLLVPRFTGKVLVRYPLVTEREPLPSQVELTAGTAGEVDALISKP